MLACRPSPFQLYNMRIACSSHIGRVGVGEKSRKARSEASVDTSASTSDPVSEHESVSDTRRMKS